MCVFLGTRSPGLSSGPVQPMHSGGDGDGGNWGGAVSSSLSLNEQIVVALAKLQEDMQSVLERLHTLEALTASQVCLTQYSSKADQTNLIVLRPAF